MFRYGVLATMVVVVLATAALFAWPRYVFIPGNIELRRGGLLTGYFVVRRVSPVTIRSNWPIISLNGDSARSGGACLVAEPSDIGVTELAGKTCTKNSECPLDTSRGWGKYGYCDTDTSKCLVRPSAGVPMSAPVAPFCNRSNDYPPGTPEWSEGIHRANRVYLPVGEPTGHLVRWTVLTCQNLHGSVGCSLPDSDQRIEQVSEDVKAVDTASNVISSPR